MKTRGKITKYNGLYGNIKGVDGNDYVLLNSNLVDGDVRVHDNVEFESELYRTPEVEVQMATFVKRLTKELKNQQINN